MRSSSRNALLVALCLMIIYVRTTWPGLCWGISGDVARASATLTPLRPPLPFSPGLIGHALRWIPLGEASFRLNLFWSACLAMGMLLLIRTLETICPAGGRGEKLRRFLPLWGLMIGLLSPLWSRTSPLDLAVPPLLALLGAFWCASRDKSQQASFLVGLLCLTAPGGFWAGLPTVLWIVLSSPRNLPRVFRCISLFLMPGFLILFAALRGPEAYARSPQIMDWLASSASLAGRESDLAASLRALAAPFSPVQLLIVALLAGAGLCASGRQGLLPAFLMLMLVMGPPGQPALGFRRLGLSLSATLLVCLAWVRLGRIGEKLALFLPFVPVALFLASWFWCNHRDTFWPGLMTAESLREAPRGSQISFIRMQTRLLWEGECFSSGLRSDLSLWEERRGASVPSLAPRIQEAYLDEGMDLPVRAGALTGFFYDSRNSSHASPSASYRQFRDRWLERSRQTSFLKDSQIAEIAAEPLIFAAEALWRENLKQQALSELFAAVQIHPTSARVRIPLAEALDALGRHTEAFAQRKYAYEQCAPDDPLVARRYGLHLFRTKGYRRALPILEEAARSLPEDQTLAAAIAGCYAALGQTPKALQLYEKALAMDPSNNNVRYNLALVLFDEGRLDEAKSHASKAIGMGFNRVRSHYLMAKIEVQLGEIESGLDHLERAVKLDEQGQVALEARYDPLFAPLYGTERFTAITSSSSPPPQAPSSPRPMQSDDTFP